MLLRDAVAAVVLLLAACGGEPGTPLSEPTSTPGPIVTGQLVGGSGSYPGAIKGVHFRSKTQSGFTDDTGTFRYVDGETVTFGIADVDFRPVSGAPSLSPWQLVAPGQCTQGPVLDRLLILLFSLDVDGDAANGTEVPAVIPEATRRSFAALSDADISALVSQLIPGRSPVDATTASDLFITQMDGELWQQIGLDEFPGIVGLDRSQGVATDGSSWFFSWKLGLQKTDLDYATQTSNLLGIPPTLSSLGDNHIGDIDYWNGTIYAPLEDGTKYLHPHIVLYDSASLTAGAIYPLSNTLLTDGVPWVAVDGPRGNLYVAEWNPTPAIFVLDLATVTYTRSIALRPTLGRIQGGKVFEGSLYLSTDDAAKDIYKVNLDTGTVIPLFAFNQSFEEEGLVFLARADGSLLHTLNVASNGHGTELRHHQRARLPLRQTVCP
jgi:hypothetical protein